LIGSAALVTTCASQLAVAKPAFSQPIKVVFADIAIGGDGVSVAFERPATPRSGASP
jgi:hypothetical protein